MKKQALYKEVNLWRCEKNDIVLRRDGCVLGYKGVNERYPRIHAPHQMADSTSYSSDGFYLSTKERHTADIVAILTGKGRTQ